MNSSGSNSLASMTRPPLAPKQIWLPKGDPQSKSQREIKGLDDSVVTYTVLSEKGRHVEKKDTLQRFLLWILQEKAEEISVIYAKEPEELLG